MNRLTFPMRQHGRYAYQPITLRPDFSWPGNKRLAVFIALNLEQYAFGEGMAEDLVPNMPPPLWPSCFTGERLRAWTTISQNSAPNGTRSSTCAPPWKNATPPLRKRPGWPTRKRN